MKSFIKSADTVVPADRSRGQVEKLLRRYGATAFSVATDFERRQIVVTFKIPQHPGSKDIVPIQLQVDFGNVYCRLYDVTPDKAQWRPERVAHAERVAWRQLHLWIDAACSAAAAGLQTMEEAFFAHKLMKHDGRVGRLVDLLGTLEQEGRLLLSAGDGMPQ